MKQKIEDSAVTKTVSEKTKMGVEILATGTKKAFDATNK